LTTIPPPEATDTRWPSLRVTAEPGWIVWVPMTMPELGSVAMVCEPSKMGEAGPVGGGFPCVGVGVFPGFPIPVPVPVSVAPPSPVPPGED
jgi:hypothetical protein